MDFIDKILVHPYSTAKRIMYPDRMTEQRTNRHQIHKGRGAVSNLSGRFEPYSTEAFDDGWEIVEDETRPKTEVQADASRSILVYNDSPDLPFDRSINPYRGCEHGCVYCFARPSHAYLGLSPGLDFETRLFSKPEAAALLETALRKSSYACQPIALGVNTDAYQPIERKLGITRSVLEVLLRFRHPVSSERLMEILLLDSVSESSYFPLTSQ